MPLHAWLDRVPAESHSLDSWLDEGLALAGHDLETVATTIKDRSGRLLHSDIQRAERLARALVRLGERQGYPYGQALGEMALGDALRLQLRLTEGYELLDRAAERFLAIPHEVGWARTRIGWVGHLHVHHPTHDPLPTVQAAAAHFERGGHWLWYGLLCNNYVSYLQNVGRRSETAEWCERLAEAAQRLTGDAHFILRYYAHRSLLELYTASGARAAADEHARTLSALLGEHHYEPSLAVEGQLAVASFYLNFGRYSQALSLLRAVDPSVATPTMQLLFTQTMAALHHRLHQAEQAELWLRRVLAMTAGREDLCDQEAYARQILVPVLRAQGRVDEALATVAAILDQAATRQRPIVHLDFVSHWIHLAHAAGQGDERARALDFLAQQEPGFGPAYPWAEAMLAVAATSDDEEERQAALEQAHRICESLPWLRWRIYLVAADLDPTLEGRCWQLERAAATLDEVQNALVTTIQSELLEEAERVYHDLIEVYLALGDIPRAWQAVERSKSRSLINARRLRESEAPLPDSPHMARLQELSYQHRTLLSTIRSSEATLSELHAIEEEMRQLYEALDADIAATHEPLEALLPAVPSAPPGQALLGYYLVGDQLHAFLHDGERHTYHRLPTTPDQVIGLLHSLTIYLTGAPHLPPAFVERSLTQSHRLLAQLGTLLLGPLLPHLPEAGRLTIVPYGELHHLPFHLLRLDDRYLLERLPLRIVPTAMLAREDAQLPTPQPRHLVASWDWGGQLAHTMAEGRLVAERLGAGTRWLAQEEATRAALLEQMAGRMGVCHIATHAAIHPDRPTLSYLELADGRLTVGDLLACALDASLVTLSACETGRITLRPGDEPLSMARAFLAVGARSLLVSLWPLDDEAALALMDQFYRYLLDGMGKSQALRAVRLDWIAHPEPRFRHPYYWGALHLIGDGGPL